jgi:hypothetical protein
MQNPYEVSDIQANLKKENWTKSATMTLPNRRSLNLKQKGILFKLLSMYPESKYLSKTPLLFPKKNL